MNPTYTLLEAFGDFCVTVASIVVMGWLALELVDHHRHVTREWRERRRRR